MNPSKRYTREIAQKEGKNLARDIEVALGRKNYATWQVVELINEFLEESAKISVATSHCKECQVSYSNRKLEGFCSKHLAISKDFRDMIKQILET